MNGEINIYIGDLISCKQTHTHTFSLNKGNVYLQTHKQAISYIKFSEGELIGKLMGCFSFLWGGSGFTLYCFNTHSSTHTLYTSKCIKFSGFLH